MNVLLGAGLFAGVIIGIGHLLTRAEEEKEVEEFWAMVRANWDGDERNGQL